MYDYAPIHRLQPVVCLDGQGLGKNMIGKLGTRKSGEDYVDRRP